jgi:hypothetical protein
MEADIDTTSVMANVQLVIVAPDMGTLVGGTIAAVEPVWPPTTTGPG